MDHRVGVLLYEPINLLLMLDGCIWTYVLLLESIRVVHTLLLRMEDLLSVCILLCISLFASSVLRLANLLVRLTKLISTPRSFCSW